MSCLYITLSSLFLLVFYLLEFFLLPYSLYLFSYPTLYHTYTCLHDRISFIALLKVVDTVDPYLTFHVLFGGIQVILLEESWSELFLLCAIQWSMPMESSPLFAVNDHPASGPTGKPGHSHSDMRVLQEVTSRFRSIQVDPAEFACHKAILLFKPGKPRVQNVKPSSSLSKESLQLTKWAQVTHGIAMLCYAQIQNRNICIDAKKFSTLHLLMVISRLGTGSGTLWCGPKGGAWGAHKAETSFQVF